MLLRWFRWQRLGGEVVDRRGGDGEDPPRRQAQPPAQIDLFEVHKVIEVEGAHLGYGVAAQEHSRATGPEQSDGCVILAFVQLDGVEYPPPAEGVPEAVDISARTAAVVEETFPGGRQQLGLTGADALVGVTGRHQRWQPARRDARVVVEEKDKLR
jgi:hypothetical protein